MYVWHWGVVWSHLAYLVGGLELTAVITVTSMAIGSALGVGVAGARLSRWWPLRLAVGAYIEFVRGTPFLVQLLWLYYAIPIVTGLNYPSIVAAIAAGSLNIAAYNGELFRAGILAVPSGQQDAALALGMTRWAAFRRVTWPQALRIVLAPLGSTWVGLFKDTSLVSIIAVSELMYRAQTLAINTFRPAELYTAAAVIYFLVTYPQARFLDRTFKRLSVHA